MTTPRSHLDEPIGGPGGLIVCFTSKGKESKRRAIAPRGSVFLRQRGRPVAPRRLFVGSYRFSRRAGLLRFPTTRSGASHGLTGRRNIAQRGGMIPMPARSLAVTTRRSHLTSWSASWVALDRICFGLRCRQRDRRQLRLQQVQQRPFVCRQAPSSRSTSAMVRRIISTSSRTSSSRNAA